MLWRAAARVSLCVLAGTALLVAAAWGFARLQSELLGELDLAGAGHALAAEVHRGDALQTRDEALNRCLVGKQEVIDALLGGRLSVREAADEFRRLDEEAKEAVEAAPAPSDEAVYGNLLAWARHAASGDARLAARFAQVRAEVFGLLHRPLQGL